MDHVYNPYNARHFKPVLNLKHFFEILLIFVLTFGSQISHCYENAEVKAIKLNLEYLNCFITFSACDRSL